MFRALLHYFLIGGLLFVGREVVDSRPPEGPTLHVEVPRDATDAEVHVRVTEEILLNEARRYGWDRRDPVVYTHLVRNMRFIEPASEEDDLTLYRRALDMGMHRYDPVVRARLLFRAREALAAIPESQMPDRDTIDAHLRAHPERFQRDLRVRFRHVFLSRTKRGATLGADATALRSRLDELGDAPPDGLGDPLPGLRAEELASLSDVREDYGDALAEVLREPVDRVWRGPVSSVYGLHFLYVVDREPTHVPPLEAIGTEVRADWLRENRARLADERMEALRASYTVHVERAP